MDFPTGRLREEAEVRILDTLLEQLKKEEFTGVLKYNDVETGNILLIGGEIKAATFGEMGGDKALERIWNTVEGMVSVYTLEPHQAQFLLKWYTDIHGFPSISPDIFDHEVSVPVPDVEDLITMLEREGMSHLVMKKSIRFKKKEHRTPQETLQDIQEFLTRLFGDFMAKNIVQSHLRRLHLKKGAINEKNLKILIDEICKNVFQRVMDEQRASEESRKLKSLLDQE
ncbi:MAG: hypothetical protein HXS47_10335 [Theionarchaea archaeon]|nr:hypothetical protein [Theionarchaea archaeon]